MAHNPKANKTNRTAAESARLKDLRERFQNERPTLETLVNSGEYSAPITQEENFALMQFAAVYKAVRQKKGLSLAEVAAITGIDKSQLSRIENALNPNPTIATLEAMAHAVGRRVRIDIGEECGAASR